MNAPAAIEYLYAVEAGHYDGNDDWQAARIIRLRITKKTPKRIYYIARDWGIHTPTRCVDRQQIERDGQIRPRTRHWWEPDAHLFLTEDTARAHLGEPARKPGPSLAELKAAMAAAHPDVGGTDAEFIAARQRYQKAKETAA